MMNIKSAAKKLLLSNRRIVNDCQFTIPSPHEYRHQWLWDSCFHAVALRHFDAGAAEKELLSLVASQKKNGMVPHESNYRILGFPLPFTSRITQPPFIARAALDVYEKSGSREFLDAIFPKLQRYHGWLEEKREVDGVLKYIDSNESGEDNSVLWDEEYRIPIHRTWLRWFPTYVPLFPQKAMLKTVTGTCVYIDALECMSEISGLLGERRLKSYYANKKAVASRAAIRLFREEDNHFYSRTHGNRVIRHKTHSLFSPLFAGLLSKSEAKKLVNSHLLNKNEFWTDYAIPTIAVDEPKFSPKGYWRGPMWININWMICRGLRKYKFNSAADKLLEKTEAAVKKSGFREYYHPLTGEGLGARDFSWSTLVVDMLEQR